MAEFRKLQHKQELRMVETLPGAPPPGIIEEVPKYANGSLGPPPAGPCSAHTQEAKGIGELPPTTAEP